MESKENKENKENIESEEMSLTSKMRENPWILSTFVLGILSLILIVGNFSGGFTGNAVSEKDVGQQMLDYFSSNGVQDLKLDSVDEVSGVYKVNFDYQGAVVPYYVTKDGKYAGSLSLLGASSDSSGSQTQTPKDIPKSNKPVVELYVFTYCPYGLQMEKAMIPVAKLLRDKIDFKIRQIGAMHGEYEAVEAKRQLCIEKEYPNKHLDYLIAFAEDTSIGDCRGDADCLIPKLSSLYSKLGIDANKINSCMNANGDKLYNAELSNSEAKGVSGSPTIIINGVETSLSRSPDAVKTAICAAFNTAPSECSQTLSGSSASAGFGVSVSTNVANSHADEQC
ncbi:MAG: hypothetical protein WC584_02485 [Candidatus Pacearchaeota archaeon]